MRETILFTGFPGFLGSELLPRVLARAPEREALCVVQSRFAAIARERVAAIEARHPEVAGRIRLAEGDISLPGLGLGSGAAAAGVVEIHHLAAVYDLAVERALAERVNVEGTRRVLELATSLRRLEALHYVSTCYVSGRHAGVFREADLDVGQSFRNHYEETKFRAELLVQEAMRKGLPAAVYRPSVVVGDSSTGATQKYDGPYMLIRWILRLPIVAVLPMVGDPETVRLNVVPRDFVVRAMAQLSADGRSRGRVFHLADPEPLTVDEIVRAVEAASGRFVVRIPLPLGVAKAALERVPGVRALMQIPSAGLDYFFHSTTYATEATAEALRGSGIELPQLRDYLPRLVEYVRAHPDVPSAAMA
jgi:thioester reductase-like protein